jgi:hypothetical protein
VKRYIEQTHNSESVYLIRDGMKIPYDEVETTNSDVH